MNYDIVKQYLKKHKKNMFKEIKMIYMRPNNILDVVWFDEEGILNSTVLSYCSKNILTNLTEKMNCYGK